ncbi:MAG: hypothetical protein WCS92_03880 [Candidatus Babeliales bacterium]|jgi:predicted alpha/beta hydrolase family esterase
MNFKSHYIILIFLIFAGCSNSNNQLVHSVIFQNTSQSNIQSNKHTLIVFVHGTILPLPSPTCLLSSLKDGFKKSRTEGKAWADYYYEELRYKTLFKCQPRANFGLENISDLSLKDTQRYPYTKLSADLYKNSYDFANQENSSNLHFYTFGWDGYLSQKSRLSSAKVLYSSLINEISKIKSNLNFKDTDLELILIGHSHGGNVLLNLAKINKEINGNLKIDKLILFGTPVQSETEELVNDEMFRKIYSLYSTDDMVQVMDIISTHDSISKRRYKNTNITSKLVQIELEIGNKRPCHNELWLFGDPCNIVYRKNLAIYPLPVFIFAPVIINELDTKYSDASEILAHIDKNKNTQCFTIKLKDKVFDKNQTLTSMPTQILAFN